MPAAVRKSARHSRARGVFVGEPVFPTWISHLGRWMPAAMRKSARHSRARGVLVGEPVHHTQAVAARSGVDACSSADAVVRMPVLGTVHVTLRGELAPGHLPQCALGPSVTGHGAPLDIFSHPSKLYPSEGEWARVRPGVGSAGSGVWMVQTGQGGPAALTTNGAERRRESRTTSVAPK